ncbi:MAG: hypothetical protein LUQ01_00195, partial [Methanolinea sp.]|nr:hypothetical protein [Methanolinea sp.]
NHLTPLVAARRSRKEQIASLRDLHHRIGVQSEIKAGAVRAIPPLEARLAETGRTFAERECQLVEQTGSIEEITTLAELEKELGILMERKTDNEREIGTITSALAHVFRKAEKITYRDEAGSLAKQIHLTTEFLTGAEIPDVTDLASLLTPVLPSIVSLVGSGEILLKNQEEKRLFVNPERIPVILSDLHTRRKEMLELTQRCEQKIQEHPLTRRRIAMRQEIAVLKNQMNDDQTSLADLKSRANDAEGTLPDLMNRLEDGLSKILGNPVKVEAGHV